MRRANLLWVCFLLASLETAFAQDSPKLDPEAKPRVIVLTDITNEPDDEQSLVRLLVYSNDFEIEGLVATTSTWLKEDPEPERIQKLVEAYGMVRANLTSHASELPEGERLLQTCL